MPTIEGDNSYTAPGDLSNPLVKLVREAKKTIDIASYIYRERSAVHDELVRAHDRGVKIRLFLDPSIKNDNVPIILPMVDRFKESGFIVPVKMIDPVKTEKVTGLPFKTMHEKFGIIDGKHVFNGSANIDSNANYKYTEDRFFFLNNPEMVKVFQEEFDRLWNNLGQWILNPEELKKNAETGKKSDS
jgi:phosphatidylserine/phosphatidylglycerophosphate/cardiolipin synthase-like enzyme